MCSAGMGKESITLRLSDERVGHPINNISTCWGMKVYLIRNGQVLENIYSNRMRSRYRKRELISAQKLFLIFNEFM